MFIARCRAIACYGSLHTIAVCPSNVTSFMYAVTSDVTSFMPAVEP